MTRTQVTDLGAHVGYLDAGVPGQFWRAAGRDVLGDPVEGPPDLVGLARPVAAEDVVRRATQQQGVGFLHVRFDLFAGLRIPERPLPAGVLEVAVLLGGATV